MRIRWTRAEGLDLTGTHQELRELRALLLAVSQGEPRHAKLSSQVDGDPTPYAAFLRGVDVELSDGPAVVRVIDGRDLEVTGGSVALSGMASFFQFDEDALPGQHSHVEYYEGHPFISATSEPFVVTVGGAESQE